MEGGGPAGVLPPASGEAIRFAILSTICLLALTLSFPPITLWPLALIGLTPWAVAVCRTRRARIAHWGSFIAGTLFFLVNLRWLMPVTGLGYAALAAYLAIYWPLAAWAIRTARRVGVGLAFSLPVAWVACEFLRGWVMTGFPWLFLAHAFYERLTLIQISDLTGAYGVSFLAAMVSGVLADWILESRKPRRPGAIRAALLGTATLVALTVATLIYGRFHLGRTDLRDGPRLALIQEDFPLISKPPWGEHPFVVFARYLALAAQAAREKPDLLVFPETVWQGSQNIAFLEVPRQAVDDESAAAWAYGKTTHDATSAFARGDYAAVNRKIEHLERLLEASRPESLRRQPGGRLPRLPKEGGPPVTVLLGSVSIEVFPEQVYPRKKKYNSALVYDPDGTQRRQRYDKHHLVPFGEYVPFRNARVLGVSLHGLYRLLNRLSPFSDRGRVEYSLWAGHGFEPFTLRTDQGTYRFATPICYEDVMPYVARRFTWDGKRKQVDFLINISNDGWFLHSAELEQHLAICVFRAVENRVGIARAVNTGISGFIDPLGRIYSVVEQDGRRVGAVGYRVDRVRLTDAVTMYSRYGDWFAILCLLLSSSAWLGGIVTRWILGLRQWLHRRRQRLTTT